MAQTGFAYHDAHVIRVGSRLLLALAALVAGTTMLVGCGATQATAPVLNDLTQVADRTQDAESASFSLSIDQSLAAQAFTFSAEGAVDGKSDSARMSIDLSSLAELVAKMGQAFGAPKGALQGLPDPDSWKVDLIRTGATVYVSSPLLAKALPSGKTWVSGDLQKLGVENGLDLGQMGAATDPRDLVDLLRTASGGLDTVGTETLRGVETTHYRATLDPDEIAKLAGAGGKGHLADELAGEIEKSGLQSVPIDVWVDSESRLRRLDAEIAAEPGGMQSSTKLSLELYDYGAPVDVTAPPAASVATIDELRPHA